MRNIIITLPIVLLLSGCGFFERGTAYLTGYAESCISGVLYYQFASGVTVAYEADGKIKLCGTALDRKG